MITATTLYVAAVLVVVLYALHLAQQPLPGCHDLAVLVREVGKVVRDLLQFYIPRLGGDDSKDDTGAGDDTAAEDESV